MRGGVFLQIRQRGKSEKVYNCLWMVGFKPATQITHGPADGAFVKEILGEFYKISLFDHLQKVIHIAYPN